MNKNYVKLDKHQNIYKNTKTKRYLAVKKIQGKQFSQTFDRVRDAIHWRHTFNGVESASTSLKKGKNVQTLRQISSVVQKNTPTLLEVWNLMRKLHFPTIASSTKNTYERQFEGLKLLHHIHMEDFVPSIIDGWIDRLKKFYEKNWNKKRYSLKGELDTLRLVFHWYKNEPEVGDYKFISPLLDRHRKSCRIKDRPVRPKKISPENAFKFIGLMPPLYRDLALFQYLTASRIGEAAGVQIRNINLEERELLIKESCVWSRNKKFSHLAPFPKNQHPRHCYINDMLLEIIERRLKQRVTGCDFLFHVNGRPIRYSTAQNCYYRAQKRAGVRERTTHILRHGMATFTRKVTGSLDATMSMTGHKDVKMADHYSEISQDVQKQTSLEVEKHLKLVLQKEAINANNA